MSVRSHQPESKREITMWRMAKAPKKAQNHPLTWIMRHKTYISVRVRCRK